MHVFLKACAPRCAQEFDAALELIDQHLKSGVAEYPLYVKALIRRQRGAARARLCLLVCLKNHNMISRPRCAGRPRRSCARVAAAVSGCDGLKPEQPGEPQTGVSPARRPGVARVQRAAPSHPPATLLSLVHASRSLLARSALRLLGGAVALSTGQAQSRDRGVRRSATPQCVPGIEGLPPAPRAELLFQASPCACARAVHRLRRLGALAPERAVPYPSQEL